MKRQVRWAYIPTSVLYHKFSGIAWDGSQLHFDKSAFTLFRMETPALPSNGSSNSIASNRYSSFSNPMQWENALYPQRHFEWSIFIILASDLLKRKVFLLSSSIMLRYFLKLETSKLWEKVKTEKHGTGTRRLFFFGFAVPLAVSMQITVRRFIILKEVRNLVIIWQS